MKVNNVHGLKIELIELKESVENLVINGIDAVELHLLLSELDKTVTRGKECIVKENCLYDEVFNNIKNLEKAKETNNEINDFEEFIKSIFGESKSVHKHVIRVDTRVKTKKNYILEFDADRIGHYALHFNWLSDEYGSIAEIELFRPNRIYKNTRAVKALVEDSESYIESYSTDEGYLIIRNDTMNKFVVFTSKDKYHFNYLEPEDICIDDDRI